MIKMMLPFFDYAKDTCLKTNNHGLLYQDITCQYPFLGTITTQWEIEYDVKTVMDWIQAHPVSVPVVTVSLYLIFINVGPIWMRNRESFGWRKSMAAWNLFLSTFSIIGFIRVFPQLIHNYATMSVYENFCTEPLTTYGSGASGLWVMLFILSKYPELVDTFFLVIHKKPVIFLHWYHHVTVLLYCWHSYAVNTSTGVIFCVMNYAVHGIMYLYYFLMAIKKKPKWFNPMWVTYGQISQMVVGVIVTILSFYFKSKDLDDSCEPISSENNTAAFIMYGSYLALFLQFFVRRYFKTKASTKKLD
mmetsp:Transcript_23566/g.35362  ORF Transcript_23566/g.35362 Transcript_23566/m.35362 type:complete len:303 (-) Transcript_23566:100-1008(-)